MSAPSAESDIFDDLQNETDHLRGILASLSPQQWAVESGAAGWTVGDVVLHLAISEESVAESTSGRRPALAFDGDEHSSVEAFIDGLVVEQRGAPAEEVFARWEAARHAALAGLRNSDPRSRLAWVVGTMSPKALATARLAEHWAHGLDVTAPLGLEYADTARLRHVAWLAHRQLPYSFQAAGQAVAPVRFELDAPDGSMWTFGDADAPSVIAGSAGEFCRVAARRLAPGGTSLRTMGPDARAALRLVRSYA